jgi:HK97 family phage major capsid protein
MSGLSELEQKALQDVTEGIKKLEGIGKDSAEAKSIAEQVKLDLKTIHDAAKANADALKAQEEANKEAKERIENLEKRSAKSGYNGSTKDEVKSGAIRSFAESFKTADATDREVKAFNGHTASDGSSAGLLLTPEMIQGFMLEKFKYYSPILNEVRLIRKNGNGAVSILTKTNGIVAGWAGELQELRNSKNRYTKQTIVTSRVGALSAATLELLDGSDYDIENDLINDLAKDTSNVIALAVSRGDGASKPKGFLNETFLKNGALATQGTGNVVTWTDLYHIQKKIKSPYRKDGKFYMSFDILVQLLTEKDGNGLPIWQPGVNGSLMPTLAGKQYVILDEMDTTVAANTLPIVYGDLKQAYAVVLSTKAHTMRDDLSGFAEGYVEFGYATYAGGQVVNDEAIVALKGV